MIKLVSTVSLFFLATTVNVNAQNYNYYFGNIHAHSSYSDGNKDSTTSHLTRPLQDFNYAKASQHVDFYGISEHNHQAAGMTSPLHYHQGLLDADSATTDGTFVAMYGMEWGVISGGGHVIIYGYDSLLGWNSNDYDVYVAQNDYTSLWKKVNEKTNSFAYLAHPQSSDYNGLFSAASTLMADNAIVGMAARSGPAFSTNTTYSDPDVSTFISRYNDALKNGYHLGIGLDHDTHNSVFGRQTAGRLVVLAPSLSRAEIMTALHKMRFYSSDDWNTKVDYTINSHPMGSIFAQAGTPTISVAVTDPDNAESVTSISVYSGIPGSGSAPTSVHTVSNMASMTYTPTIANNTTYYYYIKITQADGDIIWTSPIWYTRNDAATNNPPTADFSTSLATVCTGQQVVLNDQSTNAASDWVWSIPGGLPSSSTNQNVIASFPLPGTYTVSLTSSNSFGTSAVVTKTITVQVCTGVEELTKEAIKLFPNPASDRLTIDVSKLVGDKTVEIYDISGKLMFTKTTADAQFLIDLKGFENGTYFAHLKINEMTYPAQSFIVQRK
jgi:PKD repeat protein